MRSIIFVVCLFGLLFIGTNANEKYKYSSLARPFSTLNQPGFKVVLDNAALQYIETCSIPALTNLLRSVSIPSMSGGSSAPIIGGISWQLSNIGIGQITLGGYSASSSPGNGLQIDVNNIAMQVNANWGWQQSNWPHVSGSGSATIDIQAKDEMIVQLLADQNTEFPFIRVLQHSFTVNSMSISISSNAQWLYQLFASILHQEIQNTISSAIASAIQQHTQDGVNQALQTVPLKQNLGAGLTFDLGFLPEPEANSNSIVLLESGETYVTANPRPCPLSICSQPSLPDIPASNGQMMAIYISEYVANSALFAAQSVFLPEFWVLPSQVPSSSPIQLNTNSFSTYIPGLKELYPNRTMKFHAYTTDVPSASFSPSGAIVQSKGAIDFYVILDNNTSAFLFTLIGNATASATASLNGWSLVPKIKTARFAFGLGPSVIGTFDPTSLKNAMNFLISFGIIPTLNANLANGIQLPTVNGLSFVSPSLLWNQDYISVFSDLHYS